MSEAPNAMEPHVSVENQIPDDLHQAMVAFVSLHPEWDQYRLMQAALAGFLFQHGCQERAVVHHYLNGLFRRDPAVTATQPNWG